MPTLLHHLIDQHLPARAGAAALVHRDRTFDYAALAALQDGFAGALRRRGIAAGERVAVFLSKCPEAVAVAFGSSKAGACFVPVNPLLKPAQLAHVLRDCAVRWLVTSPERLAALAPLLPGCPALERIVLVGAGAVDAPAALPCERWDEVLDAAAAPRVDAVLDGDPCAILYTSGSTGLPKGVVVSHRNFVSGAASVAAYLGNRADDRLLAALPLSFDAGFSQLTTAFTVGACAVLLEYLTAAEVLRTLARERITGLTGVPPLWIQLAQAAWPPEAARHLRYFANTGGKLPRATLQRLREQAPGALPFLMYGLTEAFRSTYLPPEEVDRRPDSIGRAIPNQEVMVLRPDGSRCGPREPGELVHRGSTVTLGYWGDAVRTAERFRPWRSPHGGVLRDEWVVHSGDTVEMDEDGFLYFIGRRDEMIKSSGYRISPVEIEEAAYTSGLVAEAAAFGVHDERLGQAVVLAVHAPQAGGCDAAVLRAALQRALPTYMVPGRIVAFEAPLPRNANGKIDRAGLSQQLARPLTAGA
ncbi:MAG: acyl-CoA ligase (AMP-forming), exosortase A system-associated [Piscinibacter sp.]|uniref:acyl-CoA ligase (AMP-forming), exosortase A system-associated n=1 Tax=Piscinibacter TaxID=1114981 RepID=UPI000FDCE787|nr:MULTISPECIES: acyl-CoA ligase (AMP-forming), exosortase A system-associated [Piscinibacter]MCW5667458.1 acyl-CoA ligase (AMP-forming), exosortase A system-associated [Piscinibacter sp.]